MGFSEQDLVFFKNKISCFTHLWSEETSCKLSLSQFRMKIFLLYFQTNNFNGLSKIEWQVLQARYRAHRSLLCIQDSCQKEQNSIVEDNIIFSIFVISCFFVSFLVCCFLYRWKTTSRSFSSRAFTRRWPVVSHRFRFKTPMASWPFWTRQ